MEMRSVEITAVLGLLVVAVWSVGLHHSHAARPAGVLGPTMRFLGADAGAPVAFEMITVPPVVVGTHNDPASALGPFVPTFGELLAGETVITDAATMRHVWRRLFQVPFDESSIDFDSSFVILVGGGWLHPFFGFEISSLDRFDGAFSPPLPGEDPYMEHALAMVTTTVLPGPAPPKLDPEPRFAAVLVDRVHLGPLVTSRQVIALP